MLYLSLKALHIIAIVVWFAGLFYLPRLFVYHVASGSKDVRDQLKIMERRLYRIIMNNAMASVFILGFSLLWVNPGVAYSGWFHLKLLLVVILAVYHIICGRFIKILARDGVHPSEKFFRVFNEIPTFLLIIITFLAVIKPF